MKPQSIQKLFAFIIAIMIFSIIPGIADAQKKCSKGHCPKGYACVGGYCISNGGGGCNCFVRPIPFECGQICGFLAGKTLANDLFSISDVNSNAINFELNKAQNVSLKIYDMTGRLIKTLANNRMPEGEHQIEWNKRDEEGNTVSAGMYTLRFAVGMHSATKKFAVIK